MKVFDETMNSVRAGSSPRSVSAMSAPSTLETKWARKLAGANGLQRPRRHRRAEVGAADADIDDVGHGLAERAAQSSLAHVVGEGEHLGALALDVGHDVAALDENGLAGKIAQRAVQRGAPLRRIDEIAAEHRVALGLDLGRAGEAEQNSERGHVEALLGIIVEEVVEDDVHMFETRAVGGEFGADRARENDAPPLGEFGEDRRQALSASWTFPFSVRRSMRSARPAAPSLLHMPPQLQLRDIRLTLGGAPLLEGAELTISPGDRIALVGRNGSGKSTLLKIAAGEAIADGGTRFAQPNASLRYLPQEPDLTGYATTLDFVLSGLGEEDNPYRARALMDDLGVDPSADPAQLSGGEARRAALARVLAPDPDILLLDEPTNHLDLLAIEWLEKELSQIARGLRADQPRQAAAGRPDPRDRVARPRPHAPARPGFRRLRGLARRQARRGGG